MTPELTARLLALPSLRRQAEADARELFDRGHAVAQSFGFESPMWELLREDERTAVIENHARLLADLTRWQSQAWALRRIANKLGWQIGDEVPTLHYSDPHNGKVWAVKHRNYIARFCGNYTISVRTATVVDGLYMHSGRVDAIAAILLHMEEA